MQNKILRKNIFFSLFKLLAHISEHYLAHGKILCAVKLHHRKSRCVAYPFHRLSKPFILTSKLPYALFSVRKLIVHTKPCLCDILFKLFRSIVIAENYIHNCTKHRKSKYHNKPKGLVTALLTLCVDIKHKQK